MGDLKSKLENIKLHNRIHKLKKKEENIKKQIYLNISEVSEKIKAIQQENEILKGKNEELLKENESLKNKIETISKEYNSIPKFIRKIFSIRRNK